MGDEINDFEARTSEDVIRLLRNQQRQIDNLSKIIKQQHQPQVAESIFLAEVTEAATPKAPDNRAGLGKAAIYGFNYQGRYVKKESARPFFNLTPSSIGVGSRGVLARDPYSGKSVGLFPAGYWQREVSFSGSDIASGGGYKHLTATSIKGPVPGDDLYIQDGGLFVVSGGFRSMAATISVTSSEPAGIVHFELVATGLSSFGAVAGTNTFKVAASSTPTTLFAEWTDNLSAGSGIYVLARNQELASSLNVRLVVSSAM